MKKSFFYHYGSTLQEQARELRANLTEPERKLWFCFLKDQTPKFSCQKVIGPYIVDFYCPALGLAIELDGESHTETVEHDRLRTEYLKNQNIQILRFTNQEVMKQFRPVCEDIEQKLRTLVPPGQGAGRPQGLTGGCNDKQFCQSTNKQQDETTPRLLRSHPPGEGGRGSLCPLNRADKGGGGIVQERNPMKTVTIYTDGACSGNPGPGGWGAILSFQGVEKELSGGDPNTTNNRMELTAVITALEALREPCIVELYSDSKYVIDALEKRWVWGWKKRGWIKSDKKPALNVDLWERLLPLVERHQLHYHWVKGHAENEKNNRCDQLAVTESKKFQ